MNRDTLKMGIAITNSSKKYKNCQRIKTKRYRSAFTTEQINYLERQFKKSTYITSENRKKIANFLNIYEKTVKIWFQNRRMKEKRENNNNELLIDDENHINSNNKQENRQNFYLGLDCAINEQLLRSQCKNENLNTETRKPDYTSNKNADLLNQIHDEYLNNFNLSDIKCNSKIIGMKTKTKMKSAETQRARSTTTKIPTIAQINEHIHQFSALNKEFKNETMSVVPILVKKDDIAKNISSSNIQAEQKVYQQLYPEQLSCDPKILSLFKHYVAQPKATSPTNHSSNVVWKPVNVVLPGLAPTSTVTIDNDSSIYLNNQDVSRGICNRHSTPDILRAGTQCVPALTHPQYVRLGYMLI